MWLLDRFADFGQLNVANLKRLPLVEFTDQWELAVQHFWMSLLGSVVMDEATSPELQSVPVRGLVTSSTTQKPRFYKLYALNGRAGMKLLPRLGCTRNSMFLEFAL